MRGKKTDIETKAKIVEMKINTDAQGSKIAEELGVPERTVRGILSNEFAEISRESNATAELVDRNNKLQSMADALIQEMIEQKHQSVTLAQLTSVRESTFRQNQLIQGKNTENIGVQGLSEIIKEIQGIQS